MSQQNGKILVVDDEKDLADLCGDLLRSSGYSVETAYDGLEALGKLDGTALIISDLSYPFRDKFVQHVAGKYPIVAMTGGIVNDTVRAYAADEMKASALLQKPAEVDTVLEAVKKHYPTQP